MVTTIKFRTHCNDFQTKLKEDVNKIRALQTCTCQPTKQQTSTPLHLISPRTLRTLLKDNVTKTYKKAEPILETAINLEAQQIAKTYSIDKRAESLAYSPVFITLKDHKENLQQKLPCRLINPCNRNLGRISKSILQPCNHQSNTE